MGLIDAVRVQNAANLSEVVEKIMFVERNSPDESWISKKANHEFLVELLHAYNNNGLDLTFLNLDGVPIAFCLNIGSHNREHVFHFGYDRRYARFSPGFVCLYFVVKQLFQDCRTKE